MKTIIRLTSALLALILVCGIFASCGEKKPDTVKIGVTGAVYEDIWAPAIAKLKEEGINVELVQYSDFSIPNNALSRAQRVPASRLFPQRALHARL